MQIVMSLIAFWNLLPFFYKSQRQMTQYFVKHDNVHNSFRQNNSQRFFFYVIRISLYCKTIKKTYFFISWQYISTYTNLSMFKNLFNTKPLKRVQTDPLCKRNRKPVSFLAKFHYYHLNCIEFKPDPELYIEYKSSYSTYCVVT